MQKLADSNLWLALTLSNHTFHRAARAWFERTKSDDRLLFCRSTQLSFLRLVTTAEVMERYGVRALTNAEAWTAFAAWLKDDRVSIVEEPRGIETEWKRLSARRTSSPKLWMDAYLAAFSLAGGHVLATTDDSFKQYKELELELLSTD